MATGDLILANVVSGQPVFVCGGCSCNQFLEHDLELLISGASACDTCWVYDFGAGAAFKIPSFTGVNGTFLLSWNGIGWDAVDIGTATIQRWGDFPDLDCGEFHPDEEPSATTEFDIFFSAGCSGGLFGGQATGATNEGDDPSFPTKTYSFIGVVGLSAGVSGANSIGFDSCPFGNQTLVDPIISGYGGFVTITPIP